MNELQDPDTATCTVRLAGEIDLATAGTIASAADEAIGRAASGLVLDLSAVTFMDSQGLQAMVDAYQTLDRAGATLQLTAVPPRVDRLLEIAGLRQLFGLP